MEQAPRGHPVTVHEIRTLCPERAFGTRTIVKHIMRSCIQSSRAPVHRTLEEDRPSKHANTRPCEQVSARTAIIDGYGQKILGVRAFRGSPTTDRVVELVDGAIAGAAPTRHPVSDHSGQFQRAFRNRMRARGIEHSSGQAGTWSFNAKIERIYWSLKRWRRVSLMVPDKDSIQRRLDAYVTWHDLYRPHAALGSISPSEAAKAASATEPARYTERCDLEPEIRVRRQQVRGDARLLSPVMDMAATKRSAA